MRLEIGAPVASLVGERSGVGMPLQGTGKKRGWRLPEPARVWPKDEEEENFLSRDFSFMLSSISSSVDTSSGHKS